MASGSAAKLSFMKSCAPPMAMPPATVTTFGMSGSGGGSELGRSAELSGVSSLSAKKTPREQFMHKKTAPHRPVASQSRPTVRLKSSPGSELV